MPDLVKYGAARWLRVSNLSNGGAHPGDASHADPCAHRLYR
jgi:hypothetical protein